MNCIFCYPNPELIFTFEGGEYIFFAFGYMGNVKYAITQRGLTHDEDEIIRFGVEPKGSPDLNEMFIGSRYMDIFRGYFERINNQSYYSDQQFRMAVWEFCANKGVKKIVLFEAD